MKRAVVIMLLLLLAVADYLAANEQVYGMAMGHPRTGIADWTGGWIPNTGDSEIRRSYSTLDEVRRVRVSNYLFEVSFEEGRQHGGQTMRLMGSEVRKTKTSTLAFAAVGIAILCLGIWFVPPIVMRQFKVLIRRRTIVTSSHI